MPSIDFEHESRVGETIARPRRGRPNRLLGFLLTGCAVVALSYAAYVSTRGARVTPKNDNEAFNTARAGVLLGFDNADAKADNRLQLPPVPAAAAPIVASAVAAPPMIVDDGEAQRKAEEEKRRLEAEAHENARLRSGMLVIDVPSASAAGFGAGSANAGPIKVQGPEEDANRRFLANAADVETSHANKIARIDALVPQGTMIRGTLETAIESDLPGMVRAITREDVYSFDGRRVLIPSGTMLTGEYRSALWRGQTRVFVIWTRLLRSDGISLTLGSYGTDSLGRSGLPGDVDEHYFERFGLAILLSIVGGASSFVAGLNSAGQSVTAAAGSGNSVGLQAQTQAQQTVSQTFSDLANQALKDSINIPPTINVDQGSRIIVFVKRDLDFSQWYPDPVKEALYELRHPKPRDIKETLWEALPTFLRLSCEPIRTWLQNPDVIEIMVNRPGAVWVEALGQAGLVSHEVETLTSAAIRRIAEQVASFTKQSVNEETPLLSAAMPHGERFQGVLSPAAPDGGAFSIRKQVISDLRLEDFVRFGALDNVRASGPHVVDPDGVSEPDCELARLLGDASPEGRMAALKFAVRNALTIVISGGTSSGKTTFLNALLKEVPMSERVISIEDTRELRPPQPNHLALLASKGDQGLARVTIQDLLEASLRLRPDRLFLGEIRGAEAYSFLQAINTGHPGSLTTLHADSPRGAFERIALATLQAGLGLTKAEIMDYARFVVPIVVQLRRTPTRGVSEIYFNKYGSAPR